MRLRVRLSVRVRVRLRLGVRLRVCMCVRLRLRMRLSVRMRMRVRLRGRVSGRVSGRVRLRVRLGVALRMRRRRGRRLCVSVRPLARLTLLVWSLVAWKDSGVIDVHAGLLAFAQITVVAGARARDGQPWAIVDKIGRGERDTSRVSASPPPNRLENPHRDRELRKTIPRVSTAPPGPLSCRDSMSIFLHCPRIM
jgi:hypothetical protein